MLTYSPDGSSAGEFQTNFETTPIGIAVDSVGDIYKARASGAVAKLDPSGESLIGEVDPGPTAALAVEPSTDHLYVAHSGFISLYNASGTVRRPPRPPPHHLRRRRRGERQRSRLRLRPRRLRGRDVRSC